ncbi:MAG: patatin family protein [Bacteroidales bacterium]|nr:patatin family protein [Lachnoclostridium sp.]MCM1384589.1 patatin family protein [Lachnoclostridium sp.]MCM1465129.1 patatin family protein [Bacteroidales bacterium]
MYQAGLVMEGGGLKGIYTAGVLDCFLDKGLEFSHIYAVSAAAGHMCSYLSKQRGRALDVSIDYLDSEHYWGVKSLAFTGDLFNVDTCYYVIPEYLNPYDYESFNAYRGKAYSVATDIVTGSPKYFRIRDLKEDIIKIRASASLPLVARNVKINGGYYLDGGISDAIPLQKSILDGNTKNVVIMTKEEGFVRTAVSPAKLALIKAKYLKYPKVYELMADRHQRYNETLDFIARQQENGQAFLIRPKDGAGVKRLETDKDKLNALYKEGYQDAENRYEELKAYLEGDMEKGAAG